MKLNNRKLVMIALILSLVAAFGAYQLINNLGATEPAKTVPVVLAVVDIPVNKIIIREMVAIAEIPENYAHPSALKSVDDAIGKISKTQMLAKEQVLASKIASKEQPGNRFSYSIPEKQRAVTIAVTEVTGVAGLPTVGDRVDLLLTTESDNSVQTSTILQNKEILATGGVNQPQEDGTQRIVPTLTLSLTPGEAQEVTLAESAGKLKFVLRSPVDKDSVDLQPISRR